MPHHIGVDLGRQQSYCSLRDEAGARLVPLGDGPDPGLWLRWSGPTRSERITDRILRLSGDDQEAATTTVERVVNALFPELAAGDRLAAAPVVVVPSAFGPACRQAVIDGFARAGVVIPARHLVERPVAALARWLDGAKAPRPGVVCAIDNDHGQISMAAADLVTRRVLVSRPLSSHGDEHPSEVQARLADALARLHHLLAHPTDDGEPRIEVEDEPDRPAPVDHLLLSGTALDHPRLRELIAASFGSMTPEILGDATTPVLGAVTLDALDGFTTGWPTLTITLDGRPLEPGEVRSPDGAHGIDLAPAEPGRTRAARLGLVDDGRRVAVRAGSVSARGLDLPADLGPHIRVRVFDDGRVLLLGDHGTRPVSLQVGWPAPGCGPVTEVVVRPVGRRSLDLGRPTLDPSEPRPTGLSATDDRSHPATVS